MKNLSAILISILFLSACLTTHKIQVLSDPPGADISYGGDYKGQTPLTIEHKTFSSWSSESDGYLTLTANKKGYEPQAWRLGLESSDIYPETIKIRLEKKQSEISSAIFPAGGTGSSSSSSTSGHIVGPSIIITW